MPPKILVVDDNPEMRELVHMYLTEAGFTVLTACDGGDGLYLAKAEQPDLIITDVTMPNLDGIELTRQLRSREETWNIPVIVWTSLGDATPLEEAIQAGANRALHKPTHFESLIDDVNEVMREAKKEDDQKKRE